MKEPNCVSPEGAFVVVSFDARCDAFTALCSDSGAASFTNVTSRDIKSEADSLAMHLTAETREQEHRLSQHFTGLDKSILKDGFRKW